MSDATLADLVDAYQHDREGSLDDLKAACQRRGVELEQVPLGWVLKKAGRVIHRHLIINQHAVHEPF